MANIKEILNEIENELISSKVIYMRIDGKTAMAKR